MVSPISYYYKVAGRASLSFPFIFANSNYTLSVMLCHKAQNHKKEILRPFGNKKGDRPKPVSKESVFS